MPIYNHEKSKSSGYTPSAIHFICHKSSFDWTQEETVIYLCFLKVWKALSLPKLDLLSVAGRNGTEWMKVETEGESWSRKGRSQKNQPNKYYRGAVSCLKLLETNY